MMLLLVWLPGRMFLLGFSVQGSLRLEGSLSRGLCPVGRGVSVQWGGFCPVGGSLSSGGVSVQWGPVQGVSVGVGVSVRNTPIQ